MVTAPKSKFLENELISLANVGTEGCISSYITQKTGCGDSDNSWLLTANVGQRINITLIDFVSSSLIDNNKEN